MTTEKKKLHRKPALLFRFWDQALKDKATEKAIRRGMTLTGYINSLLLDDLLGKRRK